MRFTDTYKLGSVVAGEALSPLEDSRRFLVIDRQLLGLFQIFGNGVVSGWELSAAGTLSVAISPGYGHVTYMSGLTTNVNIVSNLIPNAINYIYAGADTSTRFNRDVSFFSSTVLYQNTVILGTATTNDTAVTAIDSTLRADISFIQQIRQLINLHRHRGGTTNPTKIDLEKEVTGQLPGFRIDNINADKITAGILSPSRLPLLEHSDLEHSGNLTHAQLDSFVRDLSNSNVRLLGELSTINMLQLYLATKHIWNEVDDYTTNLLAIIPGISLDSFTDTVKTTAIIDTTNHLIQGTPSVGGQLVSTTFRTLNDFNSATSNIKLTIGEDSTSAYFKIIKPLTESIVESFDNLFNNNTNIANWTLETIASADATTFKTDSSEKVDGAFSAKLSVDQQVRVQVTREFTTSADWTPYNELETNIETLSSSHGKIIFQILQKDSSGTLIELDHFELLDANETTLGFRTVTRDITSFTRTKVDAIRIYTDTALGWNLSDFIVNIDAIKLNNNLFYDTSGRIRFRLQTPQKAHWAAISWTGDTSAGGTIQARARTASSYSAFDSPNVLPFSSFIGTPGDDPHVSDNRAIEVEVALASNSTKTGSPTVRTVSISYITPSSTSGITIDTVDDFLRATKMENATVETPGEVLIDGRIDTGDLVYGIAHSVQQVDIESGTGGFSYGTPVVGIDGTSLPLSPLQAVSNITGLKESSINGAASVERLDDRTYLVTDTLNDRVVIFDKDGSLITGFATNNVNNVTQLYPVSAVYNRSNKILYIAWSSPVSLNTLDVSKITITGAGLSISLSTTTDSKVVLTGPNTQAQSSNVSPILLSNIHAAELEAFFEDAHTSDQRIYLDMDPSAAKEGINADNLNYASLLSPRGFPIFVGNLKFIEGLFRPINVFRTSTDNWLVGNAKPLLTNGDKDILTGVKTANITSVIEINPTTGAITFSDNSVDFSLLTLGSAIEINDKYIAVAGIVKGTGAPQPAATNNITISVGGGLVNTVTEASAVNIADATVTAITTDFDILKARVGVVKIVEKKSGRVVFQQNTSDGTYAADVQLDADSNLVVIEKSFADNSTSTGRVVKLDEDGNVFFQFGLEELSSPNDVRVLSTGNLIVST